MKLGAFSGLAIHSACAICRRSRRSRALAFFATFFAYRFSLSEPSPPAVRSV